MSGERDEPGDGGEPRGPDDPAAPPRSELYVVGEELPPPESVRDRVVAVCSVLSGLGGLTFAGGLLFGAPMVVYGLGLAVGLLALAVGFRRYFAAQYPEIEALEPRGGAGEQAAAAAGEEITEIKSLPRRSVLGWALAGGASLLGVSLLAPVASLGPRHEGAFRRTQWEAGRRLVTDDGRPIDPEDVPVGSVVTAWPEGDTDDDRSAVVVVRLGVRGPLEPTNPEWIVDGNLVAYSKVCTHAGCPVALFRERDDALFCPCHQATFDAARAAQPVEGPAARALPQLPMAVDDEGLLVAVDDFVQQVGPAFGLMPRDRPEGEEPDT